MPTPWFESIYDFVEEAGKLPLQFPPGEMRSYSNVGVALAVLVAERVSNQRWEDLATEYLKSSERYLLGTSSVSRPEDVFRRHRPKDSVCFDAVFGGSLFINAIQLAAIGSDLLRCRNERTWAMWWEEDQGIPCMVSSTARLQVDVKTNRAIAVVASGAATEAVHDFFNTAFGSTFRGLIRPSPLSSAKAMRDSVVGMFRGGGKVFSIEWQGEICIVSIFMNDNWCIRRLRQTPDGMLRSLEIADGAQQLILQPIRLDSQGLATYLVFNTATLLKRIADSIPKKL